MQDRAILSKFSTHRVSQQTTVCNFPKIFIHLKMTAFLNFRIFAKNAKTQICFSLLNCARQSDFVKIFDAQGISAIYSCQFCPSFRAKLTLPFGGHYACQCILFLVVEYFIFTYIFFLLDIIFSTYNIIWTFI